MAACIERRRPDSPKSAARLTNCETGYSSASDATRDAEIMQAIPVNAVATEPDLVQAQYLTLREFADNTALFPRTTVYYNRARLAK